MGWLARMFMLFIRNYRQSDLLSPRFSSHSSSFFCFPIFPFRLLRFHPSAVNISISTHKRGERQPKQFPSIEWTFRILLEMMLSTTQVSVSIENLCKKLLKNIFRKKMTHNGWIVLLLIFLSSARLLFFAQFQLFDAIMFELHFGSLLMLHNKATRGCEQRVSGCLTLKQSELLPHDISSDITTSLEFFRHHTYSTWLKG